LSCADAGVEQTAKEAAKEAVTHNADSVFLIEIVSSIAGLRGPFVFIVIGYNHYCKYGGMPAAVPGKQAYSTRHCAACEQKVARVARSWSRLSCEAGKQQTHILKLYHSAGASSMTVYSREAIPFQTRAEIPFKTL
jgi:hypothetical protein